jgi:hypothetical protein
VERVLVCILASTRAHRLTFASFKRQVLDELSADLALALAIDQNYDYGNPFWQHAKYHWTAPDREDYGEAFDLVQRSLCEQYKAAAVDWRSMLRIKGPWQGGIQSPEPQPSRSSILPFCRWLLLNGLQQDAILDRYDRFVITRSDFVWLTPHPPLSILDRNSIWLPNREHYGGLPDRHLVVSRTDVVNCLNVIEDLLLDPITLYEELKGRGELNNEKFLLHHFKRRGILHKVKYFPYVMYAAREVDDGSPTWGRGHYEPTVGHFIKYETEFRSARGYATIIRCREDWLKRHQSLLARLRARRENVYLRILSSLRLSRYMRRIANALKPILGWR